jgi:ribosomal protein S18 acetylase RimI-like enzyme
VIEGTDAGPAASPDATAGDGLALRVLAPEDESAAEALLDAEMAGRVQVRLGESVDVLALPGIGAWEAGRLAGLVTWTGRPDGAGRVELTALVVAGDRRDRGVGGALVEAVATAAADAGCRRVWLVTTNDNLDALRLYQRHRFRITQVRPGGMDAARLLKPAIPATGHYGIPLRDELVLERPL